MSKKSYMSLLKEAIAEFDTSDNVDVKGPMLDPILSWDGDGELPTNKDAASVLERYYFNEGSEKRVDTLDEADYENDNGSPASGKSMENAKGAGTEQAGTSDASTVKGGKDEKEKDIAKEAEEVDTVDAEEVSESEEVSEDAELEMENAIIEKLISEMEEEEDDAEDKEEVEEADMSYTGKGPKETMPKEKKATDPEQDAKGAGTEQAGTGDAEGEVPPRKDIHDKMVKPKQYTDENAQIEAALEELEKELQLEAEDVDAEADEEVEKDLDVDKEMAAEAATPSAAPGGPSPKKGEDWEEDEAAYSEAFKIFKEAIQEQDEEDMDDDDTEDLDEMLDVFISEDVNSDMAADKKADMVALQRKCMKFKEIGQPDKYKMCVEKGKVKLAKHYEKMKKRFS